MTGFVNSNIPHTQTPSGNSSLTRNSSYCLIMKVTQRVNSAKIYLFSTQFHTNLAMC